MSRFARIVLTAVLAMLVPLMGMAAADGLPCGVAGGHRTAVVGDDGGRHPNAHGGHAGADGRHDVESDPARIAASCAHGPTDGSPAASGHDGHGEACMQCLPCACACACAVAPPVTVVTLAEGDRPSLAPPAADAAWTAVTMPLPERPPRPPLA